jgi:phosphomannomutase
MHGVGTPFTTKAFEEFAHKPLVMVPEQNSPDPAFPTVTYPNPEEGKGALELSFKAAAASGATLVLANDPDADRLAAAELQPDGQWRMFSGNEIGMLIYIYL